MRMTEKRTTSISIQADRVYIEAMRVLAMRRETTMAALVREALDALYGKELTEIRRLFFASGGSKNFQPENGTDKS